MRREDRARDNLCMVRLEQVEYVLLESIKGGAGGYEDGLGNGRKVCCLCCGYWDSWINHLQDRTGIQGWAHWTSSIARIWCLRQVLGIRGLSGFTVGVENSSGSGLHLGVKCFSYEYVLWKRLLRHFVGQPTRSETRNTTLNN